MRSVHIGIYELHPYMKLTALVNLDLIGLFGVVYVRVVLLFVYSRGQVLCCVGYRNGGFGLSNLLEISVHDNRFYK